MTTPCCPAATRSPLTANSRAMITIATQGSTLFRLTSEMSAAAIRSLSAIGSMTFPNVVTLRRDRARYPSSVSVTAATANTAAATHEPCGVAWSRATTSTGTSRILISVSVLGTLSGNTSVSGYPPLAGHELDCKRGAERAQRRDRRGQGGAGEH